MRNTRVLIFDFHSRISCTMRFLPRGKAVVAASPSTRFASSHAVKDTRPLVRKRSRSLPPLPVTVAAGAVALTLSSSPEDAWRLRNTTHMGMLNIHESNIPTTFEEAMALTTQWIEVLRRGGLEAAQDELVERLLSCILRARDDKQSQDTLHYLIDHGILSLIVEYMAGSKPTEGKRLQQLVQSLVKLLEAAAAKGQVEQWLSLVTLVQALTHLMEQDDNVVSYVDLLRLGDALMKVQQVAHQRLEEGADASRAFVVRRSDLTDPDYSRVAESCASLVEMCSLEMPDSVKKFGLWALGALVQAINQEKPSALHGQQLEAALGPAFAKVLLELPRESDGADLQLQAAAVVDRLLHVARQNPVAVTRETYEQWMDQVSYWAGTQEPEQRSTVSSDTQTWFRRKTAQIDQMEDEDEMERRQKMHLQLQLISSRCLRTLTASPQSRRYVCESPRTRSALFELSRQVHEKKQKGGNMVDEDMARDMVSIQRHLSWAFRNICTGFQNGAMALNCLFDASWTASLLQSRRDLPMSQFFRGANDLTDLPIIGAEDYEASTEFGWVDMLTAWSASADHQVRENAIATLIYLAEQSPVGLKIEQEVEIRNKQEHILQAWLTNMLQQIRLLSGGELLAVKQMEEIAHVSKELTPGNERILFNPAVVDAGTQALAVLAEHHHVELVQQGIVPLVALLSATSTATPAQHTQCARVLANLVATYCLHIDPRSSALPSDPVRAVVTSDHVDIAELLERTASGKHFLGSIRRWRECIDPMQRSNYFRVVQNLRAYDEVVATGRLVRDVYCEGVHPIVSQNDVDPPADNGNSSPMVDVVFVHGLRGHPFGTWRTDMSNKLDGNNDVWPDVLLANDLQRNDVSARLVTLGYEAGMVSWSSPWPSLTLQERARVMLSALYAANIGRDRRRPGSPARPVVFITHSMGGLLTKKMLLIEREHREQSGLTDNISGVVFLAVPHFGSDLAKGVRSESIRKLIQTHPAIADLGADPNGRLKDLNDSFKQLGIDCLSVGEERAAPVALGLSAVVVKPNSANPGIGRFYVLPGSDHMTICKVKSRNEPLYQEILQYVIQRAGE
ncbi:Protein SERAC1 [Phytophthora citrophthora]|uniref:Protein SERAC1 n=1 Tax=Phytophthora citrophthora TaxID=4793 RepID=A0AAD9FYG2_9STRA|nr:Protein SERAC1 [Phytophthora citrophthora]